jgi:hypothetical protein
MNKKMSSSFVRGLITMGVIISMVQDWYGLERYVAMCRRDWVVISWWAWLPLVLLLMVWQVCREVQKDSRERKGGNIWELKTSHTTYHRHSR